LVNNPALVDLTTYKLDKKMTEIFTGHQLTPLFQFQNSLIYFARDKKGEIHFINRDLLAFLLEQKISYPNQKDFSVVVAKDTGHFVALFDKGVVPVSFYKYHLKPTKILNLSGLNIAKLELPVFVMPMFYRYDRTKQIFSRLKSKYNLERHDKLEKGQSVLSYLKTLLKKANVSNEILAIKTAKNLNYLADNDSRLTLRLSVNVYLEE